MLLGIALICGGVAACTDRPLSEVLGFAPATRELVAPDSIKLTYLCGNRFRVRSWNDVVANVKWDVYKTSDSGRLDLPARTAGQPYSETVFETRVKGTTRLFFGAALIQTKANGGTVCAPQPFPDSVPAVSEDLIRSLPGIALNTDEPSGAQIVAELVVVVFKPSASTLMKAFVRDSVLRGELLGARIGDATVGFVEHVFRVRGASTDSAVTRLVDAAMRHPAVEAAVPQWRNMPQAASYRIPIDNSPLWSTKLSRAGEVIVGDRYTHALNLIRAPLAWGCSVGDSTVRVGIFDIRFGDIEDLGSTFARRIGPRTATTSSNVYYSHGLRIASIIGAIADNGRGMSGMLWSARGSWIAANVDYQRDSTREIDPMASNQALVEVQNFVRLGLDSDIINISRVPTFLDQDSPALREKERARFLYIYSSAMRILARRGRYPLVLVAAGNNAQEARLNGAPAILDSFPSQVLVVGGAAERTEKWERSNTGSAVEIFAPAVRVGSLDGFGNLSDDASGTSFAAPLVAGTAGLLLAFDPRLTLGTSPAQTATIKALLIEGSKRAPERIDGKPVLDAYEVLRHAATRWGAPLCGNRVYKDGRTVFAERGAGPPEPIVSDQAFSDFDLITLNALHGGRRLRHFLDEFEYRWPMTGGGWTLFREATPLQRGDAGTAGNGLFGFNHDRTIVSGVGTSALIDSTFAMVRQSFETVDYAPIRQAEIRVDFVGAPLALCDRYRIADMSCARPRIGFEGRAINPFGGLDAVSVIAGSGASAVVAINRTRRIATAAAPRACEPSESPRDEPDGTPLLCALITQVDSSDGVDFYRVDTISNAPPVPLSPPAADLMRNRTVNWMAMSEDGRELVMALATMSTRKVNGSDTPAVCADEEMVWLPITTGGFNGANATVRRPAQITGCTGTYFGSGTIAPLKRPRPRRIAK
ncbi:MAG: S8 family serine peptidase [Gemmatimonadaceae bacterium]|nr:S8 family serine peptidase [Gemmatimonadaceae bacterium]